MKGPSGGRTQHKDWTLQAAGSPKFRETSQRKIGRFCLLLQEYQLCRLVPCTMSSDAGISSSQSEALDSLQVQRRQRKAAAREKHKQYQQPLAEPCVPRPPPAKAVVPITTRTEIEDSQLRFLIYHYVTVVTATTVTNVGPRFEWYPLAVRDEVFFHALMSSVSSHAAYLQQQELPRTFFHHRGIAIRLLNERLMRGDHDEGTINTVAVFAQQESFEGRAESAKTHFAGLMQIVRSAGGLQSSQLSEKTRRHLFLADLSACIPLSSRPILVPTVDMTNLEKYFGRPSPATASYAKTFAIRLFNYTYSPLSDAAATVLWGLRNVSRLLEDIHSGKHNPDTPSALDMQFTDRVEVLERLVHQLWYTENVAEPQHVIFRTFGWVCLIYIYWILRELPKELGMNAMLANRTKLALEASGELNVLLATFQDLLLWQMFICGRVADPRDRPFFASQASKILMVRKTEKEDDIVFAADSFLWPERKKKKVASVVELTDISGSEAAEEGET